MKPITTVSAMLGALALTPVAATAQPGPPAGGAPVVIEGDMPRAVQRLLEEAHETRGDRSRGEDRAERRHHRGDRGSRMGHGPQHGHGMAMRMMWILIDADGSGGLSLEEIQEAHERIFQAVDADGDGEVTPEEIRMFMKSGAGFGPMGGEADDQMPEIDAAPGMPGTPSPGPDAGPDMGPDGGPSDMGPDGGPDVPGVPSPPAPAPGTPVP